MADVFIFYSREDPARVEALADALRRLAPRDPMLQSRLASSELLDLLDEVIGDPDRPARVLAPLVRADVKLRRIEQADPGNFGIVPVCAVHMLLTGSGATEFMAFWQARLRQPLRTDRDISGYQQANGYFGATLVNLGLYSDALPYLRVAAETDPFSRVRSIQYAWGLAPTNDPQAAERLGQRHARWPDPDTAEALLAGAVLLGAGDAAGPLAAPPK